LRDDGFIAIAIDHVELFYLGALADEVFGRENRLGVISIVIRPQGRQFAKFFSATTEYMIVYAKNWEHAEFNNVVLDENIAKEYNQKDEKGKFKYQPLMYSRFVEEKMKKAREKYFYPIYVNKNLKEITLNKKQGYYEVWPINKKRKICWKIQKEKFRELLENNRDRYEALKDRGGEVQIYEKYREGEGTKIKTHWIGKRYNATTSGTGILKAIMGKKEFSYPKSIYAVLDIIKITTDKDDIIVDFFAGSGTTGHAVIELNKEDGGNRKYILVEQLDEHIKICMQRIQKVIENNQNENKGDLFKGRNNNENFIYCELMKYNEAYMDKIQAAETSKELIELWKEIAENSFLNWYVNPEMPEEAVNDFMEIGKSENGLDKQKKLLAELLNKNQLYVNLSEIDDADFAVSEEDKKLNRSFYGEAYDG